MAHRLAPTAENELDEIWLYVAKRSASAEIADRLIDTITEHIALLARFPFLGRNRDADLRPGVRSFAVGSYIILYTVKEEDVLVLHVTQGSRNIRALLRDD